MGVSSATSSITYKAPTFHDEPGKPKVTMSPEIKGIDPETYANSIKEAKMQEIKPKKDSIDLNTKKMLALKELNEKIEEFNGINKSLGNHLGLASSTSNVFKKLNTAGYVEGSSENIMHYIDFISTENATPGNYSLKVDQIASYDLRKTKLFNNVHDTIGSNGNLVINGKTIPITNTTKVSDLIDKIKSSSDFSSMEISAHLNTTTGTSSYISFEGKKLASSIDFTGTDSSIKTALGIGNDTDESTLKAKITYQGESYVRDSNSVDDVIPNGTITLIKSSAGKNLHLSTDYDKTSFLETIKSWVTSFNDVQEIIEDNSKFNMEEQAPDKDAILYGNSTLKRIESTLYSQITRRVRIDINQDIINSTKSITQTSDSPSINGSLVINGTNISISTSDKWTDIQNKVNSQSGSTNVTMDFETKSGITVPRFTCSEKGVPINFKGTQSSIMSGFGVPSALSEDSGIEARKSSLDVYTGLKKIGIDIKQRKHGSYEIKLNQDKFLDVNTNNYDLIRKTFGAEVNVSNDSFKAWKIPDELNDKLNLSEITLNYQSNSDKNLSAGFSANGKTVPAYLENDGLILHGAKTWIKAKDVSKGVSDINANMNITGKLQFKNTSNESSEKNVIPLTVDIISTDSLSSIANKINANLSSSNSKNVRAEIFEISTGKYSLQFISNKDLFMDGSTSGIAQALGFEESWEKEKDSDMFFGFDIGYSGKELGSNDSKSTKINITQGIAHRLSKKINEQFLSLKNGEFKRADESLIKENQKLKKDIEKLEKDAEKEAERFKADFQKVYSVIMEYEGLTKMLQDYKNSMYGNKD